MKKKLLLILVIILALFGLVMITSSSYIWAEYKFGDALKYAKNQGFFFVIGLFIMIFVSKIDYNFYYKNANKFLIIGFVLLILVLIPGIGTVRNGSQSWFNFGFFSLQPSELMKIILIIFTAKYLSNNQDDIKYTFKTIIPILSVTIIAFLLIMLQPDFGSGVVLTMSIIGLIFSSGADFSFFLKVGIVGVIGVIVLIIIAPYRVARIVSFLNPWSDPLGSGFQIIQSLYAIGPGGLFGKGLGNSIQKHFYLPEPQTDFIFSIICEELGFLGAFLVILLFALIIYLIIKISLDATDLFAKYLAFGLVFQLSFQTILNLMVVVGLIPVTGVTLPFLSYGGSSLLVSMASIGIVLNISKKNN